MELIFVILIVGIVFVYFEFKNESQEKTPLYSEPETITFHFGIYEDGEEIKKNSWYQKKSWKNKNFVNYNGSWNGDWKMAKERKVSVAGISMSDRVIRCK